MRLEHLTETAPRVLDLSEDEANVVVAAGRRLAGSGEFWGAALPRATLQLKGR